MLALLDKLRGFFSQQFLIAALLPVFVVSSINGTLLYFCSEGFRRWLQPKSSTTVMDTLQTSGGVALALLMLAYLLSSSTAYLRELLEGRHLGRWLAGQLTIKHVRRADRLRADLRKLRNDLRKLERDCPTWEEDLRNARKKAEQAPAGSLRCALGTAEPWQTKLDTLKDLRRRDCTFPFELLRDVALEMVTVVATTYPCATEDVAEEFVDLLQHARRRNEATATELFIDLHRSYGSTGAPTRLGNQSKALEAYPQIRYGFSLDLAWGKLQKILLDSKSAYSEVLQNVKAQFDAAVLLTWLVLVTTVVWSLLLAAVSISLPLFLLIAAGGSLTSYALYQVTITAHAAFADIVRGVTDLYRFKLLDELHLKVPDGPLAERRLWEKLRRKLEFGEDADLRYTAAPPPPFGGGLTP